MMKLSYRGKGCVMNVDKCQQWEFWVQQVQRVSLITPRYLLIWILWSGLWESKSRLHYHSLASSLYLHSWSLLQSKESCKWMALSNRKQYNRWLRGHRVRLMWKRSNCTSKHLPWESNCSLQVESIAKQRKRTCRIIPKLGLRRE